MFLLRNGISSQTWDPTRKLLILVFRQERIRTIFCGLCCFVDIRNPDGTTRKGEPRWIKDFIVSRVDPRSTTLGLRLDVDGEPCALAVCLPEFWEDASAGRVKESYRVPCFEIALT
jgi:hypothetical protein